MPHLRFDLNFTPSAGDKTRFAAAVAEHFGRVMNTGTEHVAVSLRCGAPEDLHFGRAADPARVALLDFDVRRGRTMGQKRELALAVIGELRKTFAVDPSGVYLVYTEHDGPDFQMEDGVLPSWSAGEDPLAGLRKRG
ncbi:MAG TPA: tautomerase [Myxococcales bacterium]|nr:tautomerase [Myxococcales bacterium]